MKKIFILITLLSFSFTNKLSQADDHLKVLWETEKIFELPESVIYDKKNDVLYVSNITDHPFNKDGTGLFLKLDWMELLLKKNGLNHSTHLKG